LKKLGVIFLLVVGCAPLSSLFEKAADEPGKAGAKGDVALTRQSVRNAQRITVECRDVEWKPDQTSITSSIECTFETNGKCTLEMKSRTNGDDGGWRDHMAYELPSGTFAEVRSILLESDFLTLQKGLQGCYLSMPMTAHDHYLAVTCGQRSHYIYFENAPGPNECQSLREFLEKLPRRGQPYFIPKS